MPTDFHIFQMGRSTTNQLVIVELRTPAMPVGVGGGKDRGGFHLNLRT